MTDHPYCSFVVCTNVRGHIQDLIAEFVRLSALRPMRNWELLVLCPSELAIADGPVAFASNLKVKFVSTEWGHKNLSRNLGFTEAASDWVYFMDQDTRLPIARLTSWAEALEQAIHQNVGLAAGPYETPPSCGYWGRAYNWLSNLWLDGAHGGFRFLAGNVLVSRSQIAPPFFNPELDNGGEEIEAAQRVRALSVVLKKDEDLALVHHADHDFWKFVRRLHQHARVKRGLGLSTGRSRPRLRMLRSVLSAPDKFPALLVFGLVSLSLLLS